jgi:hypothetical protein
MMQVFNFLNCRKLYEEINVFEGLLKNKLFVIIVLAIIKMQVLLITFGGYAFGVYSNFGLNFEQWVISVQIHLILDNNCFIFIVS